MTKHYKDGYFCGGCIRSWNMHSLLERIVAAIRR